MLRFLTAGESHGKGLVVIIDGLPSNLKIDKKYLDNQLSRRQIGYGRGERMKIEKDEVEIISGIRHGRTIGSPISIFIKNKDWENWKDIMSSEGINKKFEKISIPRPGHADLMGTLKYNYDDIRNAIERASARETAGRVVAGSIARKYLEEFEISVGSYVESIGNCFCNEKLITDIFQNKIKNLNANEISSKADKSSVRVLDKNHEKKIIKKIELAKGKGESLGGTFFVIATGVPLGLGSYVQYDRKINAEISSAIMSINAVKGVEIGEGFKLANVFGSQSNDEIIIDKNFIGRKTNHAGGIEGGITTGLPIVIRTAMKPVPTLTSPMKSIDLSTLKTVESRKERSDYVAVSACSIVAESMLCWVIAKYFKEKFGGDSIKEVKQNYKNF